MKIKINNFDYKILFMDKMEELGLFDGDNQIIKIRKYPKNKIQSTIKHELTHAYLYSYGFNQVRLTEEIVCDFFETYGERILKDSELIYSKIKEKGETKNGK